jgi:hypothetical protein
MVRMAIQVFTISFYLIDIFIIVLIVMSKFGSVQTRTCHAKQWPTLQVGTIGPPEDINCLELMEQTVEVV